MTSHQASKALHFLAKGAADVLMRYFHKTHQIDRKPGAGIVTEADKFAEQFLLKNILRKYPKSTIITEETGNHEGSGELLWVIDPLDGTSNYAHGFPWFCVSIALYEEGEPRAGVIYQPVFKELFFAEVGKGATLNRKRVRVSKTSRVMDSLLGTGFYYSKQEQLRAEMKIFERMNEAALAVRRPGSAALDLAYVACGRYDGFWERGLSPWDVAAGFILVTEAGGKISDYAGKPTTMYGREVLASNTKLHQRMSQLIQGRK